MRFFARERRRTGDLGGLKPCSVSHKLIPTYTEELDRRALWSLLGMSSHSNYRSYAYYEEYKDHVFLQPEIMDSLLKELSDAKKLLQVTKNAVTRPLTFDREPLKIQVFLSERNGDYVVVSQVSPM